MDIVQPPVLCFHCNTELFEADAKAEMACHRFLHTRCLIHLTRQQDFNHFDECNICMALLPPVIEEVDDNESIHSQASVNVNKRTRLRNLFDTDEVFRKKTKELAKARATTNKTRTGVKRLIAIKKADIRNQLLLLKAQVQGLLEGKKDEVRESQEYKQHLSAERKYTSIANFLHRNYNCNPRDISEYLRDKPGLRRFNPRYRWYYSRWRLMNRPWHYQIPI